MCKRQVNSRQKMLMGAGSSDVYKQQRQNKLFETLMEETNGILNCEASQLLLLDHESKP